MPAVNETLAAQVKGVATVLEGEYEPGKPEHLKEELSEYVEATPEGNLIEVRDPEGAPGHRKPRSHGCRGIQGPLSDARYRRHRAKRELSSDGRGAAGRNDCPRCGTCARCCSGPRPRSLLIASLGGYWISRRALQPVDAITRAAQSIGIENLSQRLDVPASGDE